MKCMKGRCTNAPGKVKGYSQFSSVKESVSAYVTNLNTHPFITLPPITMRWLKAHFCI
jgi:uncharacterized FlgJ-related protein